MAVTNKSYLDYPGLETYDSLIKQLITDVEAQIPAISVDAVNNTLVIDYPYAAALSNSSQTEDNTNEG